MENEGKKGGGEMKKEKIKERKNKRENVDLAVVPAAFVYIDLDSKKLVDIVRFIIKHLPLDGERNNASY